MFKIAEKIDKIKDELSEIDHLMIEGGHYTLTKNLLDNVSDEIEHGKMKRAKKLVSEAKEKTLKENKIVKKLDELSGVIWKERHGQSYQLHKSALEKIKEGELDATDNILDNLEEAIKNEMEILSKLKEIQSLIDRGLAGAAPEDAKRYYEESFNLLKEGEFNKADDLANNANFAAKPSPEYLLQRARDYYSDGSKKYEQGLFEESIKLWKKSKKEYERAKEIAAEKNDKDMIKKVANKIAEIKKVTEDAEIAIDNREILEERRKKEKSKPDVSQDKSTTEIKGLRMTEEKLKKKIDDINEDIRDTEDTVKQFFEKSKDTKTKSEEISIANRIKTLNRKKEMRHNTVIQLERALSGVSDLLILKENEEDLKVAFDGEKLKKINLKKIEKWFTKKILRQRGRQNLLDSIDVEISRAKESVDSDDEDLDGILDTMQDMRKGDMGAEEASGIVMKMKK